MKNSILSLVILVSTLQISTLAKATEGFPPPEQMKKNFDTCNANVPNWMENWGRFNVGFEIYAAHRACTEGGRASNCWAKAMTCGSWTHTLIAGFYCACR